MEGTEPKCFDPRFRQVYAPTGCWYGLAEPELRDQTGTFAPLIAIGVLALASVATLFVAMLTEPGILPTISFEDNSNPQYPRLTTRILINGQQFELIEYRAKFSRYTDNCIENFDHYCPWIGNAVGRRNYRWFVWFVTSVMLLSAVMLGCCLAQIVLKLDSMSLGDAISDSITAAVLAVYSLAMLLSLVGLFGFHVMAIARNVTTNEVLKHTYDHSHANPHDEGCWLNYTSFCCDPTPRSCVAVTTASSPLLRHDSGSPAVSERGSIMGTSPIESPLPTPPPLPRAPPNSARHAGAADTRMSAESSFDRAGSAPFSNTSAAVVAFAAKSGIQAKGLSNADNRV